MTDRIRTLLLTAIALTRLDLTISAQAQQDSMSFFVASVGKGNGADLGGSPARMRTVGRSPKLPARPKQTGMPI